jgi:hypothetical protein
MAKLSTKFPSFPSTGGTIGSNDRIHGGVSGPISLTMKLL